MDSSNVKSFFRSTRSISETFLQDGRLAHSIEASIGKYEYEILKLRKQLEEENSPELKNELLRKIADYQTRITQLSLQLQSGRTQISEPLLIPLSVN